MKTWKRRKLVARSARVISRNERTAPKVKNYLININANRERIARLGMVGHAPFAERLYLNLLNDVMRNARGLSVKTLNRKPERNKRDRVL